MILIYRVQDVDGRGPWRPGLSQHWIDAEADGAAHSESLLDILTPIEVAALRGMGLHIGCGCRTLAGLLAWFTPIECRRLAGLGFGIVRLSVDTVYAETDRQVVFGRRRPLAEGAARYRWPT